MTESAGIAEALTTPGVGSRGRGACARRPDGFPVVHKGRPPLVLLHVR
jgi:hypothetical protein